METRSTSCAGLLGLHDKKRLRMNLNVLHRMMGWGQEPPYLPIMWELPRQIHEINSQSKWLVVRRADSHTTQTMHILKQGETDKIHQIIQQPSAPGQPQHNDWIALEYIMPHLWAERKWDFRIHVLAVGVDPMRIFIGGPGLAFARMAVDKFNMDSRALTVHTALAYAPGQNNDRDNTDDLRVRNFKEVVALFGKKEFQEIWTQIERASLEAVLSVEPRLRDSGHLLMGYSDQCFELLGLDFMLDAKGKVYLLEVNRNNDPGYYNAAQGHVKQQVLNDELCVAGISCAQASVDPVERIPDAERPFLQPFEKAEKPLERLDEEHRRLLARAARTDFKLVWPAPKRFEHIAVALNGTEEWALSYYSRHLQSDNLKTMALHRPRVMGVTNNFVVHSD